MTGVEEVSFRMISDDDLEQWRSQGYAVVEGVLDPEELAAALTALHRLVPTFEQVRDEGAEPGFWSQFPFEVPELDHLALHPTLIDFSERALGGPVLLSHSEMLHKYAGIGDFDQEMHQDYGNNTLVVPSEGAPEQVASITYLTDVTLEMGPTAVVSLPDGRPWRGGRTWARDLAPELFSAEVKVTVPAGSTLLYTQRTFHRGTAMAASAGSRHSLHVAFQRSTVTWAGWRSFPREGNSAGLGELLCSLSPGQRSVLGFPRPDDDYWTVESRGEIQQRYPMMDLAPYGG